MKRFEEIPHTADWSFRAFGRDLPELFENAAFALFALEGVRRTDAPTVERDVQVTGIDHESLLVNWLNELLYWQDTQRETYDEFHIAQFSATALQAHVTGTRSAQLDKLVKAVTYHNLEIAETPDGWQAVLVVDV
jgi:SHS2 domain-containing protein